MIKHIITIVLTIAGLVAFFIWSDNRLEKQEQTYDKYEACVKQEYGVSPAHWYAENGQYPTCPTAQ